MSQEQTVFGLAQAALLKTIQAINDNQWNMATPAFMTMGNQTSTLRELVNRHAYDDAWVADTLAGKTIEEVGTAHDGDLLGDDPQANYAKYNAQATAAVMAQTDLTAIVHLTYGDFPAHEYLRHITSYRGFRAYTIAQLIGADTTLDPALVQGLWDEVIPDLEQWRAMGVFGPAIETADDADLQTKLLGLTGFLRT